MNWFMGLSTISYSAGQTSVSFLQEAQEEPNAMVRRMNKMIELNENRDKVRDILMTYQAKMKSIFDRKAK